MERKYDTTYQSKTGKVVIHNVAPSLMTKEEREAVLNEYRRVFMVWWRSLPVEKQLELNRKTELKGKNMPQYNLI